MNWQKVWFHAIHFDSLFACLDPNHKPVFYIFNIFITFLLLGVSGESSPVNMYLCRISNSLCFPGNYSNEEPVHSTAITMNPHLVPPDSPRTRPQGGRLQRAIAMPLQEGGQVSTDIHPGHQTSGGQPGGSGCWQGLGGQFARVRSHKKEERPAEST